MDSITQLTLGAAIGEATLGRSVGRKAAAYGAALGTLPDLDVLSSPFLSDYAQLALHRGFSHSVFFALGGGAIIAYALVRLHAKYKISFRRWFLFTFLALFTHALLDAFTVYGTQLFNPISNHPFAWNSIFIIDPLYTVPLLIGLVVALFLSRQSVWSRRFVMAGLIFSTLYLAWGQIAKYQVDLRFRSSLENQGIHYDAFLSNPTALNSVLWMGMAHNDEYVYVAMYGLLDPEHNIQWLQIPRRRSLILDGIESKDRYLDRLLWFSRGFYRVERDAEGRLFFHDLRFGRSDGYLTDRGNYIFRFQLFEEEGRPGHYSGFKQFRPVVEGRAATIDLLWRRIKGDISVQGSIQTDLYPDG